MVSLLQKLETNIGNGSKNENLQQCPNACLYFYFAHLADL